MRGHSNKTLFFVQPQSDNKTNQPNWGKTNTERKKRIEQNRANKPHPHHSNQSNSQTTNKVARLLVRMHAAIASHSAEQDGT